MTILFKLIFLNYLIFIVVEYFRLTGLYQELNCIFADLRVICKWVSIIPGRDIVSIHSKPTNFVILVHSLLICLNRLTIFAILLFTENTRTRPPAFKMYACVHRHIGLFQVVIFADKTRVRMLYMKYMHFSASGCQLFRAEILVSTHKSEYLRVLYICNMHPVQVRVNFAGQKYSCVHTLASSQNTKLEYACYTYIRGGT